MSKAVISVQNCYSWLETNSEEIRSTLWRALRFKERNYFHSRLYKQKKWDGYTEFFKPESGRFLTGLLPEVEYALNHLKCDYRILDERSQYDFRYNSITDNFLQQWQKSGTKPVTLYDYQVDLCNQILKHRRGVIQAPTSAGKTNIMISILKCLPVNCPTVILANKKSLVSQNYDEMIKWGFSNAGRLYDKYEEPNIITCATVQSLHKMDKVLGKIRCLIVDEIHEMMSKEPRKFYNKMKAASVRVAISATPFKFGGNDKSQKYAVKGFFGPVMRTHVVEGGVLTTDFLQERGTLSKSRCVFYPITEPQIPYDIYMDAVTNGIAENWQFHNIVKRLAITLKGRTLVLVERISHGDTLNKLIPGSLWVQGKDDDDTRKQVIKQLQHNEQCIAIATQGIFNTGINVFVHNLINAAGGQADHQIVQRMGRGLRTAEDKEILNYYDFVFNINNYLLDHSKKRIKILSKEGHDLEVKKTIDF